MTISHKRRWIPASSRIALLFVLASVWTVPALGGFREDHAYCDKGTDARAAIEACTRYLEWGESRKNVRASVYAARGVRYVKIREYDEAIKDLTEALNLDPDVPGGLYWRGSAYALRELFGLAIADFTRFLGGEARVSTEQKLSAIRHRAQYLFNLGNAKAAIADFTAALRIEPNDSLIIGRARAYERLKKYDDAIADYTEVIRLNPKYVFAYGRRGELLLEKTRYEEALRDFEKMFEILKNDGPYWARGRAYEKLNRLKRARADYRKVLERYPNHREAKKAPARLEGALSEPNADAIWQEVIEELRQAEKFAKSVLQDKSNPEHRYASWLLSDGRLPKLLEAAEARSTADTHKQLNELKEGALSTFSLSDERVRDFLSELRDLEAKVNLIEQHHRNNTASPVPDRVDPAPQSDGPSGGVPRGRKTLLPESSNRMLKKAELETLSCAELWIARNEIMDRNGYCFASARGKQTFDNSDCHTKSPKLSTIEKTNVTTIRRAEKTGRCR